MSKKYGDFEAINGGIANDLIEERDKYKKALEEILQCESSRDMYETAKESLK